LRVRIKAEVVKVMNPAIIGRVQSIVAHVLRHRWHRPDVPIELSLFDLCIDPIERVRISVAVEDEWNIDLSQAEIYAWVELTDIVRSVTDRGIV
jgi:acyl carrier protein